MVFTMLLTIPGRGEKTDAEGCPLCEDKGIKYHQSAISHLDAITSWVSGHEIQFLYSPAEFR